MVAMDGCWVGGWVGEWTHELDFPVLSKPSVSTKSTEAWLPSAICLGLGSLQIQMPLVCVSRVCPTPKPWSV